MGSLRQNIDLSERELSVLIGTILGDAYVEQYPKDARVAIMHSLKQKEFVDWKYKELGRFVKMKPMQSEYFDHRYGKKYFWWRFQTRRFPEFKELADIFYVGKRKVIPRNIGPKFKKTLFFFLFFFCLGGGGKKRYRKTFFLFLLYIY